MENELRKRKLRKLCKTKLEGFELARMSFSTCSPAPWPPPSTMVLVTLFSISDKQREIRKAVALLSVRIVSTLCPLCKLPAENNVAPTDNVKGSFLFQFTSAFSISSCAIIVLRINPKRSKPDIPKREEGCCTKEYLNFLFALFFELCAHFSLDHTTTAPLYHSTTVLEHQRTCLLRPHPGKLCQFLCPVLGCFVHLHPPKF